MPTSRYRRRRDLTPRPGLAARDENAPCPARSRSRTCRHLHDLAPVAEGLAGHRKPQTPFLTPSGPFSPFRRSCPGGSGSSAALRGQSAASGELEFLDHWYPIQVKQKDKVGRPDIDAFEAVMTREERSKGFFVAFDHTREPASGSNSEEPLSLSQQRAGVSGVVRPVGLVLLHEQVVERGILVSRQLLRSEFAGIYV